MAHRIQRVQYFNATVQDQPGEALRFLAALADVGVNLLAFTAIPTGLLRTQLSIFPEDSGALEDVGVKAGVELEGPHGALLVQGDDVPGALVGIHQTLYEAGINVYASTGVAGGSGGFGYIIYVRPEDLDRAARTLGV